MILVDSSFWIEFFSGTNYGDIIKSNSDYKSRNFLVPTIIIIEINKHIMRKQNQDIADFYTSQLQEGRIIDLDLELSVMAASLGVQFKLPLADSIIYATALHHNAVLYTMDKHFKGLKNVEYYEK